MQESLNQRTPNRFIHALFLVVVVIWSHQFTDFSHAKEIVLCIGTLALTGRLLTRDAKPTARPRFLLPLTAGVAVFGTIHALVQIPGFPDLAIQRTTSYLLVLLFAITILMAIGKHGGEATLQKLLYSSTTAVVVLAWIQYTNWAPTLFPISPGYEQPMYSVFGNQNLLAGWIAVTIPILVHSIAHRETTRWIEVVLLVACIATGLLIGSRSAWLAATAGCLAVLPIRSIGKRGLIASFGLAMVLLITLVFSPESTIERFTVTFTDNDVGYHTRTWIWASTAGLLAEHPFLGIGPGNFPHFSPEALADVLHAPTGTDYQANTIHTWLAHSTPLELILEFGLFGWLVVIAWIRALSLGKSGKLWGGAIAFTLFASLNSVTMSAPHMLLGLLLLATLPGTQWTAEANRDKPQNSFLPRALAVVTLILVVVHTATTLIPDKQLANARSIYRTHGNNNTTLEAYVAAAENPFASPQLHLETGLVAMNLALANPGTKVENLITARVALREAEQIIDTGELHLALGFVLYELGDATGAIKHTPQGVYRWPRHRPAWEQLIRQSVIDERPQILADAKVMLPPDQFEMLSSTLDASEQGHR